MLSIQSEEAPGFFKLVEEAKEKIHMLYPRWTNYNPADSGMALLELLAYMTELQQFHVEQLGKPHILAFLHLLGVAPEGFHPAQVYGEAQDIKFPYTLFRGTKFQIDTQIWETEHTEYLEPRMVPETLTQAPFYPFGENPASLSVFDIPLLQGLDEKHAHVLHFDLDDTYPVKRNPISFFPSGSGPNPETEEEKYWIPMVELELTYIDSNEYYSCDILWDSTCGLLQSGFIRFRLSKKMKRDRLDRRRQIPVGKTGEKYILRLTVRGEYDTAPLVRDISFHMLPLVQKDTLVENGEYRLTLKDKDYYEMSCDSWNGMYGQARAYKREREGYWEIPIFSSYISAGIRHYMFKAENFPYQDEPLAVTMVFFSPLAARSYTFRGDGSPNQEIYLPDKKISGADFEVWVEEKPNYFVPWHRVMDFAAAESNERCYVLGEEKGLLSFGDGRWGRKPRGCIQITGYSLCAGQEGNIQKGQFFTAIPPLQRKELSSDNQRLVSLRLFNPVPGTGGRNPESIESCVKRYQTERKNLERAVTKEDYEQLIQKTPGLRIKKARVFPSTIGENCLEAVVQPCTNGNRLLHSDIYERNIARFLENKKLLGTGLFIRKPQYINVTLQLEVRVRMHFANANQMVEKAVRGFFDSSMDFGLPVAYSKLYGYIDSLPETAGIRELSLHASGKGVIKQDNGDIVIPAYGMPRLTELRLNCIPENI